MLPRNGEKIPCTIMPAGAVGGFRGEGQTMAALTQLLTSVLGRPVHDETRLAGRYDWELAFDPSILLQLAASQGLALPPSIQLPPSNNPSLMTALQEQLGLRLESERAAVQVLVVDSAELPDAN
jgi:uncharacterized protein (TIGR03435 family)